MRHLSPERRVAGAIHVAHAAGTEQRVDLVDPQAAADHRERI